MIFDIFLKINTTNHEVNVNKNVKLNNFQKN